MKNYEIVYLANALKLVDAPEMDADFNYAVAASLSDATKVAKDISAALVPSEEFKEYEIALKDLREHYAEKDEEGNPVFVDLENGQRQYIIPQAKDPKSAFVKGYDKINTKYEEVLKKREEQIKFLDEENKDFHPHKVMKEALPKGLSREAMDAVFLIMEHE